jgi:hypothetical protein
MTNSRMDNSGFFHVHKFFETPVLFDISEIEIDLETTG